MSKYPLLTYKILGYSAIDPFVFDEAVDWACKMLEYGYDSENLRILAGVVKPTNRYESEQYLNRALEELSLPFFNVTYSELSIQVYYSLKIISGNNIRSYLSHLHSMLLGADDYSTDFSMLYYAWDDLDYDDIQHYYEGATKENIEEIVKEEAQKWIDKHQHKIDSLLP